MIYFGSCIDPALNTAKELYRYLAEQELFNDSQKERLNESRFFLTVPNVFEPDVKTGSDNRFFSNVLFVNYNLIVISVVLSSSI